MTSLAVKNVNEFFGWFTESTYTDGGVSQERYRMGEVYRTSSIIVILLLTAATINDKALLNLFFDQTRGLIPTSWSGVRIWNWGTAFLFTYAVNSLISSSGDEETGQSPLVLTLITFAYLSSVFFLGHFVMAYSDVIPTENSFLSLDNRTFMTSTVGLITMGVVSPFVVSSISVHLLGGSLMALTSAMFSVGFVCHAFIAHQVMRRESTIPEYKRLRVKNARSRRNRLADYPPPYPNGWYKVCDSGDLPVGALKEIEFVGKLIAIFRGEDDGKVHCLDAYCPHMGANLTAGGRVVGDCVECPFHRWQFRGDGKVTHIPYAERTNSALKTKSYPVLERNHSVYMWHHADGAEPEYEIPIIPEVHNLEYAYRGRYDQDVHMHLQEFAENSADFAHFDPLHGVMCVPWTSITIPGMRVHHIAEWNPSDEEPWKAVFRDKAHLQWFGKRLSHTDAHAEIHFYGPGGVVFFHFFTPLGNIILQHTHLPVEPLRQRTQFVWYAERSMPRALVSYVVGNWITQWSYDVLIWENKTFAKNPLLVKEDGPIKRLRKWYSQFLTPGSYKWRETELTEW
eukprot:Clim_evm5s108 gene=Clim_evmTU5s108